MLSKVPDEVAAWLIANPDQPLMEVAEKFGVNRSTVRVYRNYLVRHDLIIETNEKPRKEREDYKLTSPRKEARIRALLEAGRDTRSIADVLGMKLNTLKHFCKVKGISLREIRGEDRMSLEDASELLGISDHTVVAWCKKGWIAHSAFETESLDRCWRMTTRKHLEAFIRDKRYWPKYEVSWIVDPKLKALAKAVREYARGRWVGTPEAAELLYSSKQVIRMNLERGIWPGVGWEVLPIEVLGAWYVWLPNGAYLPELIDLRTKEGKEWYAKRYNETVLPHRKERDDLH